MQCRRRNARHQARREDGGETAPFQKRVNAGQPRPALHEAVRLLPRDGARQREGRKPAGDGADDAISEPPRAPKARPQAAARTVPGNIAGVSTIHAASAIKGAVGPRALSSARNPKAECGSRIAAATNAATTTSIRPAVRRHKVFRA